MSDQPLHTRRRADARCLQTQLGLSLIADAAADVEEATSLLHRGDRQRAYDLLYPIPADLRAVLKLLQGEPDV